MIQTLLFICIILAILIPFSKQKNVTYSYIKAYEEEHVALYDTLVYDGVKNGNELSFLKPLLNGRVLDVGSGTGHHVHALESMGISAVGIDQSPSMVLYARKLYPHTYLHGNVLNTSFFPQESFNHVVCFYFTLYYIKHKEVFFQNARHWLSPEGYLVVHLSKDWSYGPTSSFKGSFLYDSRFRTEFITKNGVETRVEHKVYMESIDTIVSLAKAEGFSVHSIYTYPLPYHGQYLYVFSLSDFRNNTGSRSLNTF